MWEWLSNPDNLKIIGLVTALVSLAGAILGLVKHRQGKASRSQTVTADRGGIAAGRVVNITGVRDDLLPVIIAAATGPMEKRAERLEKFNEE